MSKFLGPKLKLVKKLGDIPGFTRKVLKYNKDSISFNKKRVKFSQYKIRLYEKQKLRYYHCLTESQFSTYVLYAKQKRGSSGKVLLSLLVMRLDNLLFEVGFAKTIFFSKQIINHRKVLLLKESKGVYKTIVITKPNFFCKPNMVISINMSNTSQSLIKQINSFRTYIYSSSYIISHQRELKFKIRSIADGFYPVVLVKELLIIEYYNNRL